MSSLLGPSYDYWKSIKQPEEMGMSPGFSLGALATNVDGLLSYVEVLISGTGNASVCVVTDTIESAILEPTY